MASRVTKATPPQPIPKARTPAATMPTELPVRTPTHDEIRARAYQKWEAAGRPDGDSLIFWLEAEQELKR